VSYVLISGLVGLVAFFLSIMRILSKASRAASGDYVAPSVLTRINADHRDRP
jgi:hypothetical protein